MAGNLENVELTALQRNFVAAFVASGGKNATDAAREAGYSAESARQEAWRLLRKPYIQAAIRAERARAISTEGATLAWSVVNGILKDERAPYGVRLDAAKFALGLGGHVAPKAEDAGDERNKAVDDMSLAELDTLIADLQEKERRRQSATEGTDGANSSPAAEAA